MSLLDNLYSYFLDLDCYGEKHTLRVPKNNTQNKVSNLT